MMKVHALLGTFYSLEMQTSHPAKTLFPVDGTTPHPPTPHYIKKNYIIGYYYINSRKLPNTGLFIQ